VATLEKDSTPRRENGAQTSAKLLGMESLGFLPASTPSGSRLVNPRRQKLRPQSTRPPAGVDSPTAEKTEAPSPTSEKTEAPSPIPRPQFHSVHSHNSLSIHSPNPLPHDFSASSSARLVMSLPGVQLSDQLLLSLPIQADAGHDRGQPPCDLWKNMNSEMGPHLARV